MSKTFSPDMYMTKQTCIVYVSPKKPKKKKRRDIYRIGSPCKWHDIYKTGISDVCQLKTKINFESHKVMEFLPNSILMASESLKNVKV